MAKFLKVDLATVDPRMSAAIRSRHFYSLWNRNASQDEFFRVCNLVRMDCDLPCYTREKFESGWQYRTVLHADYMTARDEFFNLCFGWW